MIDRKTFLAQAGALATGALIGQSAYPEELLTGNPEKGLRVQRAEDLFTISLSQWSYHRAMFGDARDDYDWFMRTLNSNPDAVLKGPIDPRDIVIKARELGVDVVDLVNILWFGHGQDSRWLADFKKRANGEGVHFGVLMCDALANIGSSDRAERAKSIEQHISWMDTAAELGCPFLRINPYGNGSYLQQCKQAAEGLHELGEASKGYGLELLVENHGHPGGNGAWMSMLLEMTDHPRVGAFADFDNFFMGGWNLKPERRYDTHQGMLDLAPYAKAVSAKSFDFDEAGNETKIDFQLCMEIVLTSGQCRLASAEYEGNRYSEDEGTRLTVELLKATRERLFSSSKES